MSLGEYSAMYLAVWCNAVWEMQGNDPALPTVEQIYALPPGDLPQIWDYHACDPDKKVVHPRKDRAAVDKFLQDEKRGKASVIQGVKDDNDTLGVFYDSLPRVRRALANVPTYMVVDDHDVTDDWNLGRAWRDRVFTPRRSGGGSSPTRSSPTSRSRTGATTRCATARARTATRLDEANGQLRSRTRATRCRPAPASRAREALRPQPARPGDRRRSSSGTSRSTARATA